MSVKGSGNKPIGKTPTNMPATTVPTEEAMKKVMVATQQEVRKAKKTLEQEGAFGWVDEQEAEATEQALSDGIDEQVPGYGKKLFGWLKDRVGSKEEEEG